MLDMISACRVRDWPIYQIAPQGSDSLALRWFAWRGMLRQRESKDWIGLENCRLIFKSGDMMVDQFLRQLRRE